jgi:hypothetical protein
MREDETSHLQLIRVEKVRRLRLLELQQARLGDTTPPSILMEIEDLQVDIAALDKKLIVIVQNNDEEGRIIACCIDVHLNGTFASLTPEVLQATVRAIAALLNIPCENVKVVGLNRGSIIVHLEYQDTANKLSEFWQRHMSFRIPGDREVMRYYGIDDLLLHSIDVEKLFVWNLKPDTKSELSDSEILRIIETYSGLASQ